MRLRRPLVVVVGTAVLLGASGLPGLGQPATSVTASAPAAVVPPAPPGTTQLGLTAPDPATLATAKSAIVRTVKILADWSVIEARRGEFAWTDLDRAVGAAVQEGLMPVIVLTYTPKWASLGTGVDLLRAEIYSRQPPKNIADWERFVSEAGTKFRGRVSDWQVWTQLGLPHFRGTGSEYLALLKAARVRVRAIDSNARVAMAAPTGVDLGFVTTFLRDAPDTFDAVSLSPQGFSPEALLRPLAILVQRIRSAGKSVWMDWTPDSAAGVPSAERSGGLWARMLGVSQVSGVERLYAADLARTGADFRLMGAWLEGRPYLGYLVRDPDVYAAVFGTGQDGLLVVWSSQEGKTFEVPAAEGVVIRTLDGQPVLVDNKNGRPTVFLSQAPIVVSGLPSALIDEARTTLTARGPMLPVVTPDRDYGKATEVTARLGQTTQERGLYNLPYRSRANGAVQPIEVSGVQAVQTSVQRQVVYVYFDIDDTFLYFVEGRIPIDIIIEVYGARATQQVGFNILYDSATGYRFTPWQWVDVKEGWLTYTIRLTDANVANTWGWDFAINTAGNRVDDLIVRSVTVRKAP